MGNDKFMPKRTIKAYHLTLEQKRKICEWKNDSPAKGVRTLAAEATTKFGRNVSFQAVSELLKKKEEIMSQKIKPGSVETRVHDLKRIEFEQLLIKRLGEMFDYGHVTQSTIEREATILHKEMPDVEFASGTKFKRGWIRNFTRRMNWCFKRIQGRKRRIDQIVKIIPDDELEMILNEDPPAEDDELKLHKSQTTPTSLVKKVKM